MAIDSARRSPVRFETGEPVPQIPIPGPPPKAPVQSDAVRLQTLAWRGIGACRGGDWERGLVELGRVTEGDYRSAELPGLFYSYLGCGLARSEKKYREGLALCRHGLKRQLYEPDNYANLAEVLLLMGKKARASRAIFKGLSLDSRHPRLRRLWRDLGIRRRPVLPFLSRASAVNRLLGKLRHRLSPRPS